MRVPGAYIETVHNPARYTDAQINLVCLIAHLVNRGRFVLCEPPKR